jgi:hypothetical protein
MSLIIILAERDKDQDILEICLKRDKKNNSVYHAYLHSKGKKRKILTELYDFDRHEQSKTFTQNAKNIARDLLKI